MRDEFPSLEYRGYQNRFLRDWYSPRKLFKGKRQSGKTTLMLCELERFVRNGMEVAFVGPNRMSLDHSFINSQGDPIDALAHTYTVDQVRRGGVRGRHFDAVVIDEFQEMAFDMLQQELLPSMPFFIRASCPKNPQNVHHYLKDEDGSGFFHSVYEQ